MRIIPLLILLLILPAVFAAEWKEVSMKHSWDRRSAGFCKDTTQCLIKNGYNESLDNQPDRYWSGILYAEKPKCINTGQYISDNYCENGEWSSRTKLVAEQLIAVAGDNNYMLYCDNYQKTLNNYAYNTEYGPVISFIGKYCSQPGAKRTENCLNNICVLKYGNRIAFGMATNTDISGDKSPLLALNISKDECDNAKTGGYKPCGRYGVWYNHDTEILIYAPGITTMPEPEGVIIDYYNLLKDYVFTYVHNPDIAQYNYQFYDITPQFDYVYMARKNDKTIYSFKQENISHNLISTDYAGWYYENIELPEKACDRYIKSYDSEASCEIQPTETEFYIAANKKPPANPRYTRQSIIDTWPDLTGKLRIIP